MRVIFRPLTVALALTVAVATATATATADVNNVIMKRTRFDAASL